MRSGNTSTCINDVVNVRCYSTLDPRVERDESSAMNADFSYATSGNLPNLSAGIVSRFPQPWLFPFLRRDGLALLRNTAGVPDALWHY